MESVLGVRKVDSRIGQKHVRRTVVEHRPQQRGIAEILVTLGGQEQRGVVFAPGLECLDQVGRDRGVLGEPPGLVAYEDLEPTATLVGTNRSVRAIQNVKQERLKDA